MGILSNSRVPSLLDKIRARNTPAALPPLPGVVSGYGGGTFNTDGSVATPVGYADSIPGYPPPESYPYRPNYNGPDMAPEPQAVSAPSPEDPGPATPVPASAAPAKRRGGVLGALESVFAPEPGSFWWSALNNGLFNAKYGQQVYREKQAGSARALEADARKAAMEERKARYQIAGNNVIDYGDANDVDGPDFITPPQQPGETERLIEKWQNTPPGPGRDLLERAIKGYQYSSDYLGTKGDITVRTNAASAAARGAEARKTKMTAPGKAPSSGGRSGGRSSGGGVRLPSGYKIIG